MKQSQVQMLTPLQVKAIEEVSRNGEKKQVKKFKMDRENTK